MNVIPLLSRLKELEITIQLVGGNLKINAPKGKFPPGLLSRLKEQKQEVIRFLQELQKGNKYSSIEPVEEKEYHVLSSAQKRLFFIQRMILETVAYNIPMDIPLYYDIEVERLESILNRLIVRHESLRTSFHMVGEEPVQRIHDKVEVKVKVEEEAPSPGALYERFVQPFDLSQAPLLRVELVKTGEGKSAFLIDMHHIITDGTSQDILINDFMKLVSGGEPEPLRLQYKDFAEWQTSEKRKAAVKKQEEYWLKTFEEEIPILDLFTDYPRPLIQSFAGSNMGFHLEEYQVERLKTMTEEFDVTSYMLLLAIFNIFLSKLSGQEDIVIGTPVAARRHVHLNNIIGMFVNTLPMRNYPTGEKTFACFLKEVKQNTMGAYENQEYPFDDLVEKVEVNRDAGRNPVFDVMFNFLDRTEYEAGKGGAAIEPASQESHVHNPNVAKFDLQLSAVKVEDRIILDYNYCTKLFKPGTIEGFAVYFKKVVSTVVENPEVRLSEIRILTQEEKRRILYDFNDTVVDYPAEKTIHRFFEDQVEKNCDRTAVVCEERRVKNGEQDVGAAPRGRSNMVSQHLTYRELNDKSNGLAHMLREKGVGPDTIIGIMMERSIEMIIGILGILKAGGAYLPIDPDYPEERKQYMLADSGARVLLKKSEIRISKFETNPNDQNSNDQNKISTPIVLDFEHLNFEFVSDFEFRASNLIPSGLAYIIYTSGSTGKPKGVGVDHHSVVNLLFALFKAYPLYETDRYLLKTPFIFDVSVSELFGWFPGGGRLVVLGKDEHKDPQKILDAIEYSKITHINFVPSMFGVFIDQLAHQGMVKLSGLKYIFLAGEALPAQQVQAFRCLNTGITLENLYGPTEGTVYSSKYGLSAWDSSESIPIGKPLPNTKLYILDKYNHLQPIGVAGELCISGIGIARGYLNRPELTAEKFDHDLWDFQDYHDEKKKENYQKFFGGARGAILQKSPPGRRRLYKTGDLARWLPDGNIEFLGRTDFQIKIRGFRIELGDIENQLQRHHHVKEAVVIARESESGDKYLCAYIVTGPNTTGTVEGELREYLSRILPDYMIPTVFVQIEKIPLTSSGKIDRKVLPKAGAAAAAAYQAPGNAVEEKLAALFHDILGLEKVGINDNFFELGGNSLTLIKLVSLIYKEFETEIPIMQVFKNPRINEISKHIINKRFVESEESPVIIFNSSKPKKLFGFPPGAGYGIVYMELSKFLEDYCIYAFNFIEDDNLIDRYVELITRFHPGGPYTLFAFSSGGELAVEVTSRLEQEGYEVSDIILLDSYRTTKYWKPLTLDQFLENVLQHMENMGIGFLKDTAAGKIKKYGQYLKNMSLQGLAPVNAPIHLITSADRKEREKQYLSPKERRKGRTPVSIDWSALTRNDFMAYSGFGTHDHMLTGEYIEKNAAVINRILGEL